jgi:hypothetical protein
MWCRRCSAARRERAGIQAAHVELDRSAVTRAAPAFRSDASCRTENANPGGGHVEEQRDFTLSQVGCCLQKVGEAGVTSGAGLVVVAAAGLTSLDGRRATGGPPQFLVASAEFSWADRRLGWLWTAAKPR